MRLLCVFKVMLVLPAVQPGGPTTKVKIKARTGHNVTRTLWHVPALALFVLNLDPTSYRLIDRLDLIPTQLILHMLSAVPLI
jgi:hypothetical protein